ncbi:MAG: TonB-dependent siderophore receptor [Aphanocapsa sp. GSE-SYN-MK-11-07L]|nr:TonB-dependent siderophore receptor [Aphanocapsa sp. GSE-SYN-MK-11-07L]
MQVKSLSFAVVFGALSVLVGQAIRAEIPSTPPPEVKTEPNQVLQPDLNAANPTVSTLSDLGNSATTVKEWMAQIEAATAQVTAVKLNPTATGLEIVLDTADGKPLAVDATKFRAEGNSLLADIPNAVLALTEEQSFTAENPTAEIATVQVVQQDATSIRVSVTGKDALPKQEVTLKTGAFTYTLNPEDEATEEELVVTGDPDGYFVPDATTATKTDTPIRDIPFSIQVVPRQVLEDRKVQSELEALETVSGVVDLDTNTGELFSNVAIRGFFSSNRLRDGLRIGEDLNFTPIGAIERVEVLKGPASVLYGALDPGGVVNYVTRQPLAEPYYRIGFEAGNYGFFQPNIDLSGPLDKNGSVLYRLIAAYQQGGNFFDKTFNNNQVLSVTPLFTFNIGDRTNLNLFFEYTKQDSAQSFQPLLSDGRLIPSNVNPYYFSDNTEEKYRLGYTLNHEFDDSLRLRHGFAATFSSGDARTIEYTNLVDDRFLTDYLAFQFPSSASAYNGVIDLIKKFKTGSISHQLVAGFDFEHRTSKFGFYDESVDLPPLDIFDPIYDVQLPVIPSGPVSEKDITRSYGVYLQNQIAFTDHLKLLIGGRYDWVSSTGFTPIDSNGAFQNNGAFSPRIGLVYQPSKTISLYTSYSQSFRQAVGRNPDNKPFEPTKGTQYEVGVKADFLDGKLSATLAAYNITKTNVLTPDPDPDLARQNFQVQVGEQRSRGIEFDLTGEVLPGWNIVAAYALTDTKITEDNSIPSTVGNRFIGIPLHQASLWSTYFIQKGHLQGLGFGLGLFYVGERQGDLANSFQVASYLRTDAALYYRRGRFNAAINIRNLFNIDYVSSVNFGSLFINRGNPLTVIGSVSWEF